MAQEFTSIMTWSTGDVTALLSRLRLAEAFFEEMVDLPGFEPRPNIKGVALTGYNPKVSCPLSEGIKDFKARLEGVFRRDMDRNNEDGAANGKEIRIRKIIYKGTELTDKKTLEDYKVSPSDVIHVIVGFKKRFGFF